MRKQLRSPGACGLLFALIAEVFDEKRQFLASLLQRILVPVSVLLRSQCYPHSLAFCCRREVETYPTLEGRRVLRSFSWNFTVSHTKHKNGKRHGTIWGNVSVLPKCISEWSSAPYRLETEIQSAETLAEIYRKLPHPGRLVTEVVSLALQTAKFIYDCQLARR